ncbi:hypothetical protein [Halorientalis marina]|uniref:hypothetical protein n=1 Tax=Halorientalis marina TaxID=2931976 RepID=UPI001FF393A8|nr:hypothetical protein [Halorientalis marina]
MRAADRVAPLAVALLLLLAGCGSGPGGGTATEAPATTDGVSPEPTAADGTGTTTADESETAESPTPGDGTPTPASTDTGAPSYTVTVENGTLPINATRTYARVQSLLDSDAEPWPVRVRNLSEWRRSVGRVGASPLNRALGFENVSVDWSEPTGVTRFGAVYVHPGDGSAGKTERVLAHEFVHLVQYRTTLLPWAGRLTQQRLTTDRLKTRRSLVEGGAVYVADVYAHRYLDVQNNSAYVRNLYESGSATYRSALAQYRFGAQYVAHRIDDPANLSRAYDDHPRTTEQVIHNYSRSEEPPANLSVVVGNTTDEWASLGNNTLGEMTTRTALGTELTPERAAVAATGWGTDHLAVFQHSTNDSRFGWAWVLRWDTAAEAGELETALDDYATARDRASPADFRVVSLDDRTVALVFGDPAFVTNATVRANGNVTVAVGE